MPDQEYFRKSAQNQPVQEIGENVYATSDREDRKLNRFSDKENIATLRGGQPSPPVEDAARRSMVRDFVGDSMRHLSGGTPDTRQLLAERYGQDAVKEIDSLSSELERARSAMGLTRVSTVSSDVNPLLSNEQRLALARREVGLNREGTGPSTEVRNNAMLRAEGNVHLASDATPEERRLNRRALLEREQRNTYLGGDQSFTDLAANRVRHRDLTRRIQDIDKEARESQTQALEERKLTQEAREGALDRKNELDKVALQRSTGSPAEIQAVEWYAENLFGGDKKQAAEFYRRSRSKPTEDVEAEIWSKAYNEFGDERRADDAVMAFRNFMGGQEETSTTQSNIYRLVGPNGEVVEAVIKNGQWVDATTGQPLS